jgi:hypothetical protein
MFNRINIYSIIRDHFKTLRNLNGSSGSIYWKDFIVFILIPLIVSTFLSFKDYSFENQLGNLIAGISIFGGFLFNLLAIIYGQMDKIKSDTESEKDNKIKKIFIKEIHVNISFCIVLSILIVLSLLLTSIDIPMNSYKNIIKKIIITVNYFLMSLFLLTLLMILNRVYILLKRDSE